MARESLHSICRWTFNAGKGGFVPGDMRPEWGGSFGTPEMIELVAKRIRPRLPEHVVLGIEMHYDAEVDDNNAAAVADALVSNKLYLAMITPGAHTPLRLRRHRLARPERAQGRRGTRHQDGRSGLRHAARRPGTRRRPRRL